MLLPRPRMGPGGLKERVALPDLEVLGGGSGGPEGWGWKVGGRRGTRLRWTPAKNVGRVAALSSLPLGAGVAPGVSLVWRVSGLGVGQPS